MSVIVKGMKFPENCLKCDLRGYDANAGEEYCPFTQIVCLNIGRQDACPLQELPEKHGRLIDAEALIDTLEQAITIMETMLKQLDLEDDDGCLMELKAYRDIRDGIKEIDAVIEAEGE